MKHGGRELKTKLTGFASGIVPYFCLNCSYLYIKKYFVESIKTAAIFYVVFIHMQFRDWRYASDIDFQKDA